MEKRPEPRTTLLTDYDSQLLQAMIKQSLLGVCIMTPDLAVVQCNESWAQMVADYADIPVANVVAGKQLFDLMPTSQRILDSYIEQVLGKEPVGPQPARLQHKGEVFYWEIMLKPLLDNNELVGIIFLIDDNTRHVLTRLKLKRSLADRTEKLSALYDVISAATDAPDIRTTLEWSLKSVLEAMEGDAGMIQLINDFDEEAEVESLRLVASTGLSEATCERLATMPINSGLTGWAMTQDGPLMVSDISSAPQAMADVWENTDFKAYIGIAMHVRDRAVGVLSVLEQEERRFSDIEIGLMSAVGDQIGVVVENAYLHHQAEELAVIEERNRLARELHDSVTQAIYSLTLFAEAGLRFMDLGHQERVALCLQNLNDTSHQALKEMRLLLYRLRPPDLAEEGLAGALQQRLEAVETRANVEAQLVIEGDIEDLPEVVEEQLFRIAQEALNNALKHSSASLLTVHIRADEDTVELVVIDDGEGFDVAEAEDEAGMGLKIMEERAEELEGELVVASEVGEGTTVKVTIDLDELELEEEDDLFG